jgi:uncharacterized protein involved in outer membrane biogenesis
MLKKVLLGVAALVLVVSIGLFFWAREVFTQDNVRTALGEQLSKSIGQPVVVGGIGASIFPRVAVDLTDVEIGKPARIHVHTLKVGTDFRALLSRRIEHAAMRLDGAKVELPLPDFTIASTPAPAGGEASSASSVKIVSIDEIVLRDVNIISGGHTLHGDVELVPEGAGVRLRKVRLAADKTTVDVSGQITNLSGPTGELSLKAGALNFDDLLAFAAEFAKTAGTAVAGRATPSSPRKPASPSSMNLALSLDADSASMGGLLLQKLSGRARITAQGVMLDPVRFGVFGGSYNGTLALEPGSATRFHLKAALADVDMAAVTKFGGSPDTISGRLSGTIDLAGNGVEPAAMVNSTRGTARVDITNGVIKRLGLVRAIVTATSGRSGVSAANGGRSPDEPFSKLGATLSIAGGAANTNDLRLESNDLLLTASGVVHLDGSATALTGQVQLSDALSKQAGRDLVRYTQQEGRVTLPAAISGPADNLQVRIDVASLAQRAIVNRANEEVKKGLGRLFGK